MSETKQLQKSTREYWVVARTDEDAHHAPACPSEEDAREEAREKKASWKPGRGMHRLWKMTSIAEEHEV